MLDLVQNEGGGGEYKMGILAQIALTGAIPQHSI